MKRTGKGERKKTDQKCLAGEKELGWGSNYYFEQSVATPSGISADEATRYNTGCVALAGDGLLPALS